MITAIKRHVTLEGIHEVEIKGSIHLPLRMQESPFPSAPPNIMKTWGA